MTLEEAKVKCKMLEELNLDIWNAVKPSTKSELRSMFHDCYKSIIEAGFKVLRKKVLDNALGYRVPKYSIREDGSESLVDIIDNRGKGNHHGDCTTRAISFCTGVDYETIQKEQFANTYCGISWRNRRVWTKSLFSRGFCEIALPKHTSAKVFIHKFKDAGIDDGRIAALSSSHLFTIDMSTKKILDTWNSAGCRIKSIFVPVAQKCLWTVKLNAILG